MIHAILTIVRAWFVSGQPTGTKSPLGMFESWSQVVGGILENAGIGDFLTNTYIEEDDAETEAHRWLISSWYERHRRTLVTTKKLSEWALEEGSPVLEFLNVGHLSSAASTKFGNFVRTLRDRVYSIQDAGTTIVVRVRRGPNHSAMKTAQYSLIVSRQQ
jgi:putative DNA primase/helicase